MPIPRITKKGGITVHWLEYSAEEIKQAWNTNGQGHDEAVNRKSWCVTIKCNEEQAINI